MRLPIISVILTLVCVSQPAAAQDRSWQTVSIPEICTFQIPPTMEIQKGTYKQRKQVVADVLEIELPPDGVVALPKGSNAYDPRAPKPCCRILVQTIQGKRGEYETIDTPLAFSQAELREVNAMLKQQLQQETARMVSKEIKIKMEILSLPPAKIVRVGGADALRLAYKHSLNGASPVLVNIYSIQNNDRLHKITISYRISEKKMWAADMDKVIDSFKFKKR